MERPDDDLAALDQVRVGAGSAPALILTPVLS
jgi:hypothetical protein